MKYNKVIAGLFFQEQKLPPPDTEFRFHPERKWRFDFAWPDCKVALEVDGGIWISGGHNRGAQMLKTWEKENEAACMGWRILRCEPKSVCLVSTAELIRRAITVKAVLDDLQNVEGQRPRREGRSSVT